MESGVCGMDASLALGLGSSEKSCRNRPSAQANSATSVFAFGLSVHCSVHLLAAGMHVVRTHIV